MAREIAKQPWRLGLILLVLVAFVTGLLLFQALGRSPSEEPAVAEIAAGSSPAVETPGAGPAIPIASTPPATSLEEVFPNHSATSLDGVGAVATTSFATAGTAQVLAPPAGGRNPASTPPQNPPSSGLLSGTVMGAQRACADCPIEKMVPLSGIVVYLVDSNMRPTGASATTGVDGQFRLAGVAAGGYNAYFQDSGGKYDSGWYLPESLAQADPIEIVGGRETAIAMTLYPAVTADGSGTITGHVSDTNGKPIADVTVIAYRTDVSAGEVLVLKGLDKTDISGNYLLSGLPANEIDTAGNPINGYKVLFVPAASSGYPQQWYQAQATHETAKILVVGSGAEVDGIDALLGASGSIRGTVSGNGLPLAGTLVDIFDDSGVIVSSVITDLAGGYESGPLAAGGYKIRAVGSLGFAEEWYNDKSDFASAYTVSVLPGAAADGIDLNLDPVAKPAAARTAAATTRSAVMAPDNAAASDDSADAAGDPGQVQHPPAATVGAGNGHDDGAGGGGNQNQPPAGGAARIEPASCEEPPAGNHGRARDPRCASEPGAGLTAQVQAAAQ